MIVEATKVVGGMSGEVHESVIEVGDRVMTGLLVSRVLDVTVAPQERGPK